MNCEQHELTFTVEKTWQVFFPVVYWKQITTPEVHSFRIFCCTCKTDVQDNALQGKIVKRIGLRKIFR